MGSQAVQSVMAQGMEAEGNSTVLRDHTQVPVFKEVKGSIAGIAPSVMVSYTPEGLHPNLESEDPTSSFL